MDKLVGIRYKYKGKVLGKVTVLTEPRVGFHMDKNCNITTNKSCLVACKCGSKHEVVFRHISNDFSGVCPVCKQGKNTNKRVKSLFKYWVDKWKPTTYKPCTYKLPFFKGIQGEEYVAGFCYVDKDTYNYFIKVMCIKPKKYMQANMSRDNMERLGLEYKGCRSTKAMFVHRYSICKHAEAADHINGVSLDNRRCNTRSASIAQNNYNKKISKYNTTGFIGVIYNQTEYKCWKAQIGVNSRTTSKSFYTKEEAIEYRDCLSLHLFGEFCKLNLPEKIDYYKQHLEGILEERHLNWTP